MRTDLGSIDAVTVFANWYVLFEIFVAQFISIWQFKGVFTDWSSSTYIFGSTNLGWHATVAQLAGTGITFQMRLTEPARISYSCWFTEYGGRES